ncbi:MAG: zf-HC2 domain-containing protein [Thermoanaerobaculia bacterium]
MEHEVASQILPEFVEGELDAGGSAEFESHLESCSECRGWVETYWLLAAVARQPREESRHLTTDELVDIALAREPDPGRTASTKHLATCLACRREIELVQAAAAEGRAAEESRLAGAPLERPRLAAARRLALAASLVLASGAALFVWHERSESSPERLSGAVLSGTMLVESNQAISIDRTEISAGADITVSSSDVVSFGDGFVVDSGASLVVKLENPSG